MFIKDGKRFNIYATHIFDDIQFPAGAFSDILLRVRFKIKEVPDPVRMPDETHYNQEIDEAPYLISTPKPQEFLDSAHNAQIVAKIVEIENSQLRALREAVLTGDKTKLQQLDEAISAERAKLKTSKGAKA